MTVSVVGSWSRSSSWAIPYSPAPMKKSLHVKIGSNPAAAPASVPTVSTPRPCSEVSWATYFAASEDNPGLVGPSGVLLIISVCPCRCDQPVRHSNHPSCGNDQICFRSSEHTTELQLRVDLVWLL